MFEYWSISDVKILRKADKQKIMYIHTLVRARTLVREDRPRFLLQSVLTCEVLVSCSLRTLRQKVLGPTTLE